MPISSLRKPFATDWNWNTYKYIHEWCYSFLSPTFDDLFSYFFLKFVKLTSTSKDPFHLATHKAPLYTYSLIHHHIIFALFVPAAHVLRISRHLIMTLVIASHITIFLFIYICVCALTWVLMKIHLTLSNHKISWALYHRRRDQRGIPWFNGRWSVSLL